MVPASPSPSHGHGPRQVRGAPSVDIECYQGALRSKLGRTEETLWDLIANLHVCPGGRGAGGLACLAISFYEDMTCPLYVCRPGKGPSRRSL
jgi:hypothetical protein